MLKNDLLLRTIKGEDVERTPVWLMRQAGRVLPEYRKIRDSLKGFKELVQNPELACEVTLQPVKRFGVMLRHHKSEKTIRGPGSLGPWHGHRQYRVPKAGQMGFHQRIEYNKQIININDDVSKINAKGGFIRYGEIKNQYMLIKGSLGGTSKRIITLTVPRRHIAKLPKEPPAIVYMSKSSQQ